MPKDKDSLRRQVTSTLRKVADGFGLELAEAGRNARMRDFDPDTGYWADPAEAASKPPRWILQLLVQGGACEARLPVAAGSRRVAYYNTANRSVGVGCFRINAAVKLGAATKFVLHEKWDWLVWFAFDPALGHGSAAEPLGDFDPKTGGLFYMGHPQPYVAAGLVGLCDPADALTQGDERVTYGEATAALRDFINVAPSLPAIGAAGGASDA